MTRPDESKPWPPRIIFNSDGGAMTLYRFTVPISEEQSVSIVTELEDTAVDLFCMAVGSGSSIYWKDSKYGEVYGQDVEEWVGLENEKGRRMIASLSRGFENLYSLQRRGIDHFGLNVSRAKQQGMRCFGSIRMNDTHEDSEKRIWFGRSRFKRENPHLLIGGPVYMGENLLNLEHTNYTWAFNYAMPEVRDLFCGIIEETCTKYDVDGIELDFLRTPVLFKPGECVRNIPLMNDFMRRVRKLIDDLSAQKGRRLLLMARVPGETGAALGIGFDNETWIKEGLVDILVPMVPGYLESELEIREHVELARDTEVLIYGGLELHTYAHSPGSRIELLRSVAADALDGGAAGIYVFNYDCHREKRAPEDTYTEDEHQALCELHDPEILCSRDKIFFVTPDPGWGPSRSKLPKQLPRLIGCTGRFSDDRQSCRVRICDDLERVKMDGGLLKTELRVLLQDAESCADRLFCLVNGERIELSEFRTVKDRDGQLFHVYDDPPVSRGDNRICFLIEGVKPPDPWPIWRLCDVAVRYQRSARTTTRHRS